MTVELNPKIEDAFRSIFEGYEGPIHRGLTAAQVPGWDSIRHANLILALEEALDRDIDLSRAFDSETFGDLLDLFDERS